MEWTTVPCILKAWEKSNVRVVWLAKHITVQFDASPSGLHPCVIQYAFTSRHVNLLNIRMMEEEEDINTVNCASDHIEIVLKDGSLEDKQPREVCTYVIAKLQEIVKAVVCKSLPLQKAKQGRVIERLNQKVPIVVEEQHVMIFYHKPSDSLCFVGELEARVSAALDDLGIVLKSLDTENLHIDVDRWNKLDALGVQQFLKQQSCDIVIEKSTLKGPKEQIDKSKEVIALFESSIHQKDVKFSTPECAEILLDIKGDVNEIAITYFYSKVKQQFGKDLCYLFVGMKKDENTSKSFPYLRVYTREENKLNGIVKLISDCVTKCRVNARMEETQRYIFDGIQKNKLREICRTDSMVELVCTRDIFKRMEEIASMTEEEEKLSDTLVEYFTLRDPKFIPEAEKRFSVTVRLVGDTLYYKGSKAKIKELKKFMKQQLIRRLVPVTASSSILQPLEKDIDKMAAAQGCSCKLKSLDQPNEAILKSCEYITTWCYHKTGLKISLVCGDPFVLEFDSLFVLTNDSLYPLYDLNFTHADLIESSAEFCSKTGHPGYGKIVSGKPFRGRRTLVLNFIVARVHLDNPERNKQYNGLKSLFAEGFCKAVTNGCKTIGIPVPMLPNFLSVHAVVEAFVSSATAMRCGDNKCLEVFLCCMKSNEITEVMDEANKVFDSLGSGITRQLFTDDYLPNKDTNVLMCKIKNGSLIDMKVEAIVDTTNKKLDLSQGALSRLLLETAGPQLQDELETKYWKGIEYGEIAVTGSHNITKKNANIQYIFHGALPKKSARENYQQHVYQFVWNCLIKCELNQCSRIAFPALGAGKLAYPHRDVAKAMFDAVEAFQSQVLQPCLKKIIFAMPSEDSDLFRIFEAEENRRKKGAEERYKKIPKQKHTGYQALVTTVKGQLPVTVTVAVGKDIGVLPSNVVEIFLSLVLGPTQPECSLKHSLKKLMTWNDQLTITVPQNQTDMLPDFKAAAAAGVNWCLNNRVTEILVHTCRSGTTSSWLQIETVLTQIQAVMLKASMSSFPLPALHSVYFSLCDAAELDLAMKNLVQPKSRFDMSFASFASLSFFSSRNQFTWQRKEVGLASESGLALDLVGRTEESVQAAESSILQYLDFKMKDAGEKAGFAWVQKTDSTLSHEDQGTVPEEQPLVSIETDLDDAFNKSEQISKGPSANLTSPAGEMNVSADIHPSIIAVKKDDLNTWLKLIQKAFKVSVQKHSGGRVITCGSLSQLLKFEKYLDETFPQNPAIASGAEASAVNVAELSQGQALEGKFSHGNKAGFTTEPVKSNGLMSTKKLKTEMSHDVKVDNPSGSVSAKIPVAPKPISAFMATGSGLNLHAVEGSIVSLAVDCIVSATNEHLSDVMGVAKAIAEAAGPDFKEACKKIAREFHPKVGDCFEAIPGRLPCKTIMLAVGPRVLKGQDDMTSLKQLEDVVLSCLQKADGAGLESIALPFIGAGETGMNVELCIQQYYRAVTAFDLGRMCVSDIYFVDVKRCNVDRLQKAFQICQNQKTMNASPNLSVRVDSFGADRIQTKPNDNRQVIVCEAEEASEESRETGNIESMQPIIIQGIGTKVTVVTEIGDISRIKASAVVSIEDIEFRSKGTVARVLCELGGKEYTTAVRNLKGSGRMKHCLSTIGGGELQCKYVLHVVAPSWNTPEHVYDPTSYEQDVQVTMVNILWEASRLHCTSLVMPVLDGSGDTSKIPLKACCRAIVSGIREFCKVQRCPQLILFVDPDQTVVMHFYRILQAACDSSQGQTTHL